MQKNIIITFSLLFTTASLGAWQPMQKSEVTPPVAPKPGTPAPLPEYYRFLATNLKNENDPTLEIKKIKAFLAQRKNRFNLTDPKILYPILKSIQGKFNISPSEVYLLWGPGRVTKNWYDTTMQSIFPYIHVEKAQREISSALGPWNTPDELLTQAIKDTDLDKFKKVLVYGTKPNADYSFAAVSATARPPFLKALLQAGLNPNYQSPIDQTTLLIKATQNGRDDLVGILLKQGANPKLQDEKGKTALDYASGKPEIAKMLHEKMR